MEPTELSAAVDVLVEGAAYLSSEAIHAVAGRLASGEISLRASAVRLRAIRGVDGRSAEAAARMFARVRDDLDGLQAALALRTADGLRDRERRGAPRIEIAWTGPDAGGPLLRPTFDVIREMLNDMRAGGEALIVGYSLTAEKDSPMQDVIDLLTTASQQGAQITFVLHRDREAENLARLADAWHVFAVKPRVYTWDPPTDAPYTKLHAKALIVDRMQVLVTSANFTYHGMKHNLELGLRVRGPQALAIARRFDHLIAEGVLRPWER